MVNVRAYKYSNRMLVQFFDSGEKNLLRCPDCGWHGTFELATEPTSSCEVRCDCCQSPIGFVSSPLGLDTDVSPML